MTNHNRKCSSSSVHSLSIATKEIPELLVIFGGPCYGLFKNLQNKDWEWAQERVVATTYPCFIKFTFYDEILQCSRIGFLQTQVLKQTQIFLCWKSTVGLLVTPRTPLLIKGSNMVTGRRRLSYHGLCFCWSYMSCKSVFFSVEIVFHHLQSKEYQQPKCYYCLLTPKGPRVHGLKITNLIDHIVNNRTKFHITRIRKDIASDGQAISKLRTKRSSHMTSSELL